MTPLPDAVRRGVERALSDASGRPERIVRSRAVSGGCINPSARVDSDAGRAFFLKWNPDAPPAMFAAEADGLRALSAAAAGTPIRVPAVLGLGGDGGAGDEPPWLLLEHVERGRAGPGWGISLGRGLAALHRADAGGPRTWGWDRDNFIGSLPQENGPAGSWADFWRDARLLPQARLARERGFFEGEGRRVLDRLLDRTGDVLGDAAADGPSLLHGDLWSGNVFPGPDGEPVLVDPAVYRGHREVDLAMSELFGGFPAGWPTAYEEAWPLGEGYRRARRPLYQLYYLLVHVNLFGGGYEGAALTAARKALAGV